MNFLPMINLDQRWLKASIIGSIWGSFEIIMGSFLHNLKIPFAGSIMAFFSILLMIAFLQRWKEKGIIWRSGLIAALMKSLSPSAFLIGPMTGIFIEALIIELVISAAGINIITCSLAGGLSLLSALIHKLLNLYILYGNDFILIYNRLLSFLFKDSTNAGYSILLIIGSAYFVFGLIAALSGYFTGKRIVFSDVSNLQGSVIETFEQPVQTGNRSVFLMLLHFMAIPILMFLNVKFEWYISLLVVLSYISLLGFLYPSVLKRLKKPMLWLQILFVLVLSLLFLGSYTPENGFGFSGFIAGVKLNLRALIVISGFAAIGYELKNEKIQHWVVSYANPSLYHSVRISFGLLPGIMRNMNSPSKIFLHPLTNLKMMLVRAEHYLNILQQTHGKAM